MFTAAVFNTALWVKLWLLEIAQQPTNQIRIDFGPISQNNGQRTRYLIAETSIYQKTSTVNKCPQDFSYWNPWQQVKKSNHLTCRWLEQRPGGSGGILISSGDIFRTFSENCAAKEEEKILKESKYMQFTSNIKILQWSDDIKSYSMLIKLDLYMFSRKPSSACPCIFKAYQKNCM